MRNESFSAPCAGASTNAASPPAAVVRPKAHNLTILVLDGGEEQMSFDVEKAKCYLEKDRQHLLAVIETGFGTLDAFSAKLQSLMQSRRLSVASFIGESRRLSLASFIREPDHQNV